MLWEARLNTLEDEAFPPGVEGELSQRPTIDYSSTESELTEWASPILTHFFDCYCPQSTPDERRLFRHRAQELRQIQSISNTDAFLPLAVMRLEDEYFGLALDSVKEFITIRQVTPIPCCPAHIIGDINLRGEIVTIIDIRRGLNLSTDAYQDYQDNRKECKAIVVQIEDIIAGIIVDQVLDVIYVPPDDVASIPTALSQQQQDFFQGVVSYSPKPLTILSLQQLFSQGDLVVDQAA
ncbi:MAG: chemotaxis protein CheW, partial [Okeania sp. SIO2H7]|nr:chemotaxis protein CheW [Okeania sp. SIO2H7]